MQITVRISRSKARNGTTGETWILVESITARVQRAVLAGRDLATAAGEAGLEPADLADAADAYHLAGIATLERHAHARWN
ncbi:hypothetical protein [Frankia sp. Cas4]|uniref:hypothetical protein n=1 Tax=Frankia sp. Cas4 TaxID=3073927 RepID=UPI002AD2EF88|nr:hypothetical protein [Frankia sp. Cas4]